MDSATISAAKLAELGSLYPDLPHEYFVYLGNVGWGEAATGRMVYSAPVAPQDVYGPNFDRTDIVLLGDDFLGYCFGYDLTNATYGEITPNGMWQASSSKQGLRQYVGA